jgi:hypothetical protein
VWPRRINATRKVNAIQFGQVALQRPDRLLLCSVDHDSDIANDRLSGKTRCWTIGRQIKNPVEHREDVATGPEQRRGQFSE